MTIGKRSPASRRHARNVSPHTAPGPPPACADRLDAAAWLVGAAAGLIVMALVLAAADGLRGTAPIPGDALQLYRALDLNDIALVPAGRKARRPEPVATTIDWRFQPALPRQDPGVIRLLEAERLLGPQVSSP